MGMEVILLTGKIVTSSNVGSDIGKTVTVVNSTNTISSSGILDSRGVCEFVLKGQEKYTISIDGFSTSTLLNSGQITEVNLSVKNPIRSIITLGQTVNGVFTVTKELLGGVDPSELTESSFILETVFTTAFHANPVGYVFKHRDYSENISKSYNASTGVLTVVNWTFRVGGGDQIYTGAESVFRVYALLPI